MARTTAIQDICIDDVHEATGLLSQPSEPTALATVPTERLEEQMMTLAGHLAAATCSFLVLLAEFDRRKGYSDWECASSAHWLNWRCGVSMCAAREQVRVARRLVGLPRVREEFSAGRLSYSKVRAITRVATPEIEHGLVNMAQHATAAQMDRACAALRRVQDLDASERELEERESDARERQHLTWRRDDNGDLIVRARLCPEDAETFIAAIEARTEQPGRDEGDDLSPLDRRRAAALVEVAASACAAPDPAIPTTPEIIVHIDAAAAARWTHGGTTEAQSSRYGAAGNSPAEAEPAPWPVTTARGAPVSWALTTARGAPVSWALASRLACDAGLRFVAMQPDGSQLDLGRHTRTVNRSQRRALQARDSQCRFPGCQRRSRLHAHHIVPWQHGGRTDMDNLLLLCPAHHRAVHENGWHLAGTAADHEFRRPAGEPVEPCAPELSGSLATLVALHERWGLDIALDGAGGRWCGDRIDWDCFFAAFAAI
jgi:hypothetical protein